MSRKLLLPRGVLLMTRHNNSAAQRQTNLSVAWFWGYQRRELCGSWRMNINMALLRNPLQGMRYADTKGP